MRCHRTFKTVLAAAALLAGAVLLRGDAWVDGPLGPDPVERACAALSTGASTASGGEILNAGQTAVGNSDDGTVYLQAGIVPAMVRYAPPPFAPSGLACTVTGGYTVDLAWTDNSSNEDAFVIERKVGAGSFAYLDTVPADTVAYVDVTCVPATDYAYRVCAVRDEAWSAWSNEDGGTTPILGDLDMDGDVDFVDFTTVKGNFGSPGGWCDGDMDNDGDVDFVDFTTVKGAFGNTAAPDPAADDFTPPGGP